MSSAIAKGDFSQKAAPKSDKDILALAINQIVSNFGEVVNQANRIAQGKLDTSISLRSDHDELGKALMTMTSELKKSTEEKQHQLWVKNNQTELNDLIRGEQEVADLSRKVVSKMCRILDARVGAIFLRNEDEVFKLMGSYAFSHRKDVKSEYRIGEGLIGQAALEKQPIVVSKILGIIFPSIQGWARRHPKTSLLYRVFSTTR